MMFSLRRTSAVAAMVASVALVAGCTAGGAGANANTLEFWAYEPNSIVQKEALEQLIVEFETANDIDVRVTYVPKDSFNTKLNSSIAVGRNPDVSYLDQPLTPRFAGDGLLLDVTEQLEAGLGADSFAPAAMDTNVVEGRVYGVPLSMTTVALYYNKALVASPPTTWEEWLDSARDVYVPNTTAAFEGIGGGGWGAWLFPAFVHSGGGSMVSASQDAATFGDEAGVEAASFLVELQSYSDQAVRQSENAFGNGIVAYKVSGPWEIEALSKNFPNLDFGVAPLPAREGFSPVSNIGGENLVIFSNSTKQELAYELVEFLTGAEGMQVMAGVTGNFATNLEAAAALDYVSDPMLAVFAAQLENAIPRPTLTDWLKVNDEIVGSALDSIFVSGEDPEAVLVDANNRANVILFGN
jgi:ABC-type glycerol-3-phosphate transport system substrate-binding protein